MNIEYLVKMANQIGAFFASETGPEAAARDIAGHLKRFWAPRMRAQIVTHVEQENGAGLNPLVVAAIRSHRDSLCGGKMPILEEVQWVGAPGASDAG